MSIKKEHIIDLSMVTVALFAAILVFLSVYKISGQYLAHNSSAKKGLIYRGMVLGTSENGCPDGYQLINTGDKSICTHGPDPAPDGIDVRVSRDPEDMETAFDSGSAVKATSVSCTGDGQSGNRVQLIYARAVDKPDRFAAFHESFKLWAQQINDVIDESAAKTGGTAQIRFVHDSSCVPSIINLEIPATADDNFNQTVNALIATGHSRNDRKYLIWTDANVYCGLATMVYDDRSSAANFNNTGQSWARVDNGCWGLSNSVEAHELIHMLGGVQPTAPNSDGEAHCTDDYDRLCYQAGTGAPMTYPCAFSQERLFDCNDDDYFSSAPPANSYLATHWNTATNSFLQMSSTGLPNNGGNKPSSNANWQFENLDGGPIGLNPSANTVGITPKTVNYGGDMYAFYYDSTARDLKLALSDETGWHYQTLDGNNNSGGRINGDVGRSIVAEVYDNTLHIFYYDATNLALRHAWYSAIIGWQFETLDGVLTSVSGQTANVGMSNFAIKYFNDLHLFYYDGSHGNLRHSWFTPGKGWSFENLEGDPGSISHANSNIGQNPAAAVYGTSLQLVYYDVTSGNLRHSWFTPGKGWSFENLEGDPGSISRANSNMGQDPTMITHNGSLQIFHYDVTYGNLRHAWADSRGWHFENLEGDPGSISGFNANVGSMATAFSFNNVLYVFFRENSNGTARYTWADSSGWHFVPLEGNTYSVSGLKSNTGFWPTIAELGGSLHLYYFDNDQRALRHVFGTPY